MYWLTTSSGVEINCALGPAIQVVGMALIIELCDHNIPFIKVIYFEDLYKERLHNYIKGYTLSLIIEGGGSGLPAPPPPPPPIPTPLTSIRDLVVLCFT